MKLCGLNAIDLFVQYEKVQENLWVIIITFEMYAITLNCSSSIKEKKFKEMNKEVRLNQCKTL